MRLRVRIVLDTNVVLSALLWRGTPYRLIEAVHQRGDVQLISSRALLDELADVLTRPSAAKRLAIIGKTAQAVLADYAAIVEMVVPAEVPRVVPSDADDDQVIAAAAAGGAEIIVSGDGDLLSIGSHRGIDIVTARELGERLAAGLET